MANICKAIGKEFLNQVLPAFGNPKLNIPVWDEGQKMFICEEYESACGNRYYKGVRFCNKVVVVEKVGLSHTWTYIDAIEVYAFDGSKLSLVQKQDYDKVFRSEEFVRKEVKNMLCNYLKAACKIQGVLLQTSQIEQQAKDLVDACYKSLLDKDYNVTITKIIPQLKQA